ncbi:hypothetical protein [Streptomyces sp. NPDC059759]|uniref:hypothetical protein n=1 Tax=Streptomyces sp. NPDC059759 TaxID=3346936 RepID=UPI00364FC9B1
MTARRTWPDGRVAYQVLVDTDGTTSKSHRTFWWPHEGLRVAHRSAAEPPRKPAAAETCPARHDA